MSIIKNWGYQNMTAVAVMFAAAVILTQPSKAADLGGNCCSDLEERIAELEATTAKKGNRKVSLVVYGQISEALVDISGGGISSHMQVQSNSNRDAQSVVVFAGKAQFSPGLSAGFVLQIGVGGFANGVIVPASNGLDTNGVYVREEFVYVQSDAAGKLSIGKQKLATYDVTGAVEGNTSVAHTMLSFAPLVGPTAGSALDLWDGGITDAAKYTSPHWFGHPGSDGTKDGLWVEAAWANADNLMTNSANGNLYDVAIKYLGEVSAVQVSGQAGYRNGMVVDLSSVALAGFSGLNVQDIKVWSAGGGVKHMPTGLFANASYGSFDYSTLSPGAGNLTAWEVQAGIEQKWTKVGKTSLFGQYARYDLGSVGLGSGNTSYGLGVVQNIEGAATDLYLTWEDYQPSDTAKANLGLTGNVAVIFAGIRTQF